MGAVIVIVPKNGGKYCFCRDFHPLNEVIIRDSFSIPRMCEFIDIVRDATIFFTVYKNSRYWQVEVAHEERDNIALASHHELLQLIRMSFRRNNDPPTFGEAMDSMISHITGQLAVVYLGDIVMFSNSSDKHISNARNVLTLLKDI